MTLIDRMNEKENGSSTKIHAVIILIAFFTFTFTIIMLWTTFLPGMESAAEETQRLIEETGGGGSISTIQGDYIPEIKLVYTLSLICFGLLDGIFALMLWKGKTLKNQEIMVRVLAELYVTIRAFCIIVITMLSIMTLIRSTPRLFMDLLYFAVLIFSVINLTFILYFHRKIMNQEIRDEILFKIPDEAAF